MLNNKILSNIALNVVLALAFVLLNVSALDSGLEETLVAFALAHGTVTVIGNAMFMAHSAKGNVS